MAQTHCSMTRLFLLSVTILQKCFLTITHALLLCLACFASIRNQKLRNVVRSLGSLLGTHQSSASWIVLQCFQADLLYTGSLSMDSVESAYRGIETIISKQEANNVNILLFLLTHIKQTHPNVDHSIGAVTLQGVEGQLPLKVAGVESRDGKAVAVPSLRRNEEFIYPPSLDRKYFQCDTAHNKA